MRLFLDDCPPLLEALNRHNIYSQHEISDAWRWLIQRRRKFPANSDIWHLRYHKEVLLPGILKQLTEVCYLFSPMLIIHGKNGTEQAIWCAADSFVLKLITNKLQKILPIHKSCTHIKGNGGHKQAVRKAHHYIAGGAYQYVGKTDIRAYYANINKHQLFEQLAEYVKDPILINLLGQFLFYSVEKGGNFHTPYKGIPRGCPLSPLLAGFHFYQLDKKLSCLKGVRYLRFMDDLLILSKTRWQLRRGISIMNSWFEQAGLKQHTDKTFIGRIERGFDWLGYAFATGGLKTVATKTVAHHLIKLNWLYEQACKQRSKVTFAQVVEYKQRWRRWVGAGLTHLVSTPGFMNDDTVTYGQLSGRHG